jgi:DNA-binding transcriptional regulator LsrR (DeoR family)
MSTRDARSIPRLRGPAELVLAAAVARRYYLDGQNKVEIADALHLSRFKVARLLDAALQQGLVRIEIASPGGIDLDLSAQLREAFRLKHAIVVDAPAHDPAILRNRLGQSAADLLTELVTVDDVLGLAWSRSVQSMVAALRRLAPVAVVQLTGVLTSVHETSSSIAGDSSIDVVREAARRSGGPAYLYFAPFLVHDAATALALRRQPDVARAFQMIPQVTLAVVGVGAWAPGQSTLYDAATQRERDMLTQAGVCADVGGVFLTADGTPLTTPLNERMIAANAAQMRDVDTTIAIAYGRAKEAAVLASLRSGLIGGLVTHAGLAKLLLAAGDVGRKSA